MPRLSVRVLVLARPCSRGAGATGRRRSRAWAGGEAPRSLAEGASSCRGGRGRPPLGPRAWPGALTDEQVSQLLWAAQGITDPPPGTAPRPRPGRCTRSRCTR